jgi:hypothetical protein
MFVSAVVFRSSAMTPLGRSTVSLQFKFVACAHPHWSQAGRPALLVNAAVQVHTVSEGFSGLEFMDAITI